MASRGRGLSHPLTIRPYVVALVLGAVAVACGGDLEGSAARPSPVESPPPVPGTAPGATVTVPAPGDTSPVGGATLEATAPRPPEDPVGGETGDEETEDVIIYFAVEGGYAALTRSIVIADDGTATKEISGRSSSRQLPPEEVRAIVDQLDESGLFDRDRTYPADGADLQRYEIRYRGATIVAHDTSVPPELTEAIQLLEAALRA